MKQIHINGKHWLIAMILTALIALLAGCSCGKENQNMESSTHEATTQGTSTYETTTYGAGLEGTSAYESSMHENGTEEIGTSSTDGVNQMTQPEYGTSADTVGGGTPDPIYVPGVYSGSAKGYGGTIEVTVEVDETHILSVKAVGEKETETIGQKALQELSDQIVKANSTEIDGVSGATYSSQGLFEAVEDALAQAYTGD